MADTIIKKDLLQADVERYLDQPTSFLPWVNMMYSSAINNSGDTVTVQTFPNVTLSTGGTAGADITDSDFTITGTNITANQVDQVRISITDFDQRVSNLDLRAQLAERIATAVKERMETYYFSLHTNADTANELDDGDLTTATNGGTGNAAAISKTNVYEAISKLKKALRDKNADVENAGVFVSPAIEQVLIEAGYANGTDLGTADGIKGKVAKVAGLDIYVNTRVPAGFMIALDKHAIHGVAKYAKVDVRPNPNGFSDNIIVESIFGGALLPNGSDRIATFAVTNA